MNNRDNYLIFIAFVIVAAIALHHSFKASIIQNELLYIQNDLNRYKLEDSLKLQHYKKMIKQDSLLLVDIKDFLKENN